MVAPEIVLVSTFWFKGEVSTLQFKGEIRLHSAPWTVMRRCQISTIYAFPFRESSMICNIVLCRYINSLWLADFNFLSEGERRHALLLKQVFPISLLCLGMHHCHEWYAFQQIVSFQKANRFYWACLHVLLSNSSFFILNRFYSACFTCAHFFIPVKINEHACMCSPNSLSQSLLLSMLTCVHQI